MSSTPIHARAEKPDEIILKTESARITVFQPERTASHVEVEPFLRLLADIAKRLVAEAVQSVDNPDQTK